MVLIQRWIELEAYANDNTNVEVQNYRMMKTCLFIYIH